MHTITEQKTLLWPRIQQTAFAQYSADFRFSAFSRALASSKKAESKHIQSSISQWIVQRRLSISEYYTQWAIFLTFYFTHWSGFDWGVSHITLIKGNALNIKLSKWKMKRVKREIPVGSNSRRVDVVYLQSLLKEWYNYIKLWSPKGLKVYPLPYGLHISRSHP